MRIVLLTLMLVVLAGCAVYAKHHLDESYGTEQVRDRNITELSDAPEYHRDIKPILDNRCVVCHGCYDAPCQLKMTSFEGIDRGASKDKVYESPRLLASDLSRLFLDAENTQQWRQQGFYPVLNEREQQEHANLEGSMLYRLLAMKKNHPLPKVDQLSKDFDFSLNRDQQCPKIEEFDQFEAFYPQWGMPYGLPAVSEKEFNIIETWLKNGAKTAGLKPLAQEFNAQINLWESFFNGRSLKQQLVSRYIYEHLFIANLYFSELPHGEYFHLVRSLTPSGEPIKVIASRRPYDDPEAENFYYRLQRVKSTIVAKRHMPYRLDTKRMARWQQLFFSSDYTVNSLPSYLPEQASNPFLTFKQLPAGSRYRFMLDEAAFTISGFIKGPVCRGQVALSVINDRFWVLFRDPDDERVAATTTFVEHENDVLKMPAEVGSETLSLIEWLALSKQQEQYIEAKEARRRSRHPDGNKIHLNYVWDGDGHNENALLTVFRHFDSATVEKGLQGEVPKTVWMIGYPLLERIHYLLVSGFDVYGNTGHQLLTRLYMDFLRMEGERNFLSLLPVSSAEQELEFWYRDEEQAVEEYIDSIASRGGDIMGIPYQTDNPKRELFNLLEGVINQQVLPRDEINRPYQNKAYSEVDVSLQRLAKAKGELISHLPEQIIIRLNYANKTDEVITVLSNRARSNVLSLFEENQRLRPKEQTLTVLRGVTGAYPNVFLEVGVEQLSDFVDQLLRINDKDDYRYLLNKYAVRRTDERFWAYSDWLNAEYQRESPIEAGLLDYNRLENR